MRIAVYRFYTVILFAVFAANLFAAENESKGVGIRVDEALKERKCLFYG